MTMILYYACVIMWGMKKVTCIIVFVLIYLFSCYVLQKEKVDTFRCHPRITTDESMINWADGKFKKIKKHFQIYPQYYSANDFSEGLAAVETKKLFGYKWGFIDKHNRWIIKPKFDNATIFKQGLAAVKKHGKWGYINKKGKWVIKPVYKEVRPFSENRTAVLLDKKVQYIDTEGQLVFSIEKSLNFLSQKQDFKQGLAAFKKNNKWGFIDKKGNISIKPKFEEVYSFQEGLAAVSIDGKWGFINKKGNWVIKPKYTKANSFNDGLAPAKNHKSWMLIDAKGKEKVELKNIIRRVYSFHEGLASIYYEFNYKSSCGYIDRKGNPIVLKDYSFNEKGKYYPVDASMCPSVAENFMNVTYAGNPRPFTEFNMYFNKEGKSIIGPIFGDTRSFNEGFAVVEYCGYWGYLKHPYKDKIPTTP